MTKSRNTMNWDSIYKQKISSDITVKQFLSRIKYDPCEIYKFDIRHCIEQLREESITGTQSESKIAREILKKAGLQAFIPKESSKRKTQNHKLKSWENNPSLLIQDIEQIKGIIKPHWKRLSKKILRDERNRNCIEALLKGGEKLTDDMLYIITEGERDKDLTHLAISILAESNEINFEKLKRTYYSNRPSKTRGVSLKELNKSTPSPYGLKPLDFYKLLNKLDDSVPDQTYPEYVYENTYKLYSMHHRFLDLAK